MIKVKLNIFNLIINNLNLKTMSNETKKTTETIQLRGAKMPLFTWVMQHEREIEIRESLKFNTHCYTTQEIENAIIDLCVKFHVERTSTGIHVTTKN